jgi:ATPase subunit of ABC transporter with duplicated ATPase domains
MQMPYDLHEAKHAEVQRHPHQRGAKDDAKQQQQQSRTVQQHVDALEERVRTSELGQQAAQGIDRAKLIAQQGMDKIAEMASTSGASVATAAAQQPRAIQPLSTNDYSFSSISDPVGMRRPILKPGSVSSRSKDRIGLTGDPLPSWETPSEVGMETAVSLQQQRTENLT